MNTNPFAKRILCFGDSLVWGYIPSTQHFRHPANNRWTGILQDLLGNEYEIIEEGLNSRGITSGDPRPGKEGRSAMDYIIPCLDTHDPLDFVIILLGTNELKYQNQMNPEQVGESMEKLVEIILNRKSQFKDTTLKIILLSIPVINEDTDYCQKDNKYQDARDKSIQLAEVYSNLANKLNIGFVDLSKKVISGKDGIHLDASENKKAAEAIYEYFRNNF